MNSVYRDVLKTLSYADIFDYPLTKSEIYFWLISSQKQPNSSIRFALSTVSHKSGYYHLPSRQNIVPLRLRRQRFSQAKLRLARQTTCFLKLIPFIRLIAVTGALAMNNSDQSDDIDLMIITQKNRLWSTRLLVLAILSILGRRRHYGQTKANNQICPNLFLDQTALSIPRSRQNLYTAHEICQLKPLFERHQTYQQFLAANSWIKKYLPNAYKALKKKSLPEKTNCQSSRLSRKLKGVPLTKLADNFNHLAFKLQHIYMKPKITREKISLYSAFFHPRPTGKIVLQQYKTKTQTIL